MAIICFTTFSQAPGLVDPCPTEYSVSIPANAEFSKWLTDNMTSKTGPEWGTWITGFQGQRGLEWISMNNNCWLECELKGGSCSACMDYDSNAVAGYCCSGVNHQSGVGPHDNGDCPSDAVVAQKSYTHSCVIAKKKIPSQTKIDLAVYAGYVVNTIDVNGERYGANSGGNYANVPMQEGETILRLEYGIWINDAYDYSGSICGLYFVTNIQKHGPYAGRVMKIS